MAQRAPLAAQGLRRERWRLKRSKRRERVLLPYMEPLAPDAFVSRLEARATLELLARERGAEVNLARALVLLQRPLTAAERKRLERCRRKLRDFLSRMR